LKFGEKQVQPQNQSASKTARTLPLMIFPVTYGRAEGMVYAAWATTFSPFFTPL